MVKTILPVRVVADNWSFFYRQGAIDRLRCVVPMPIIQSPAFRTTMSYHHSGSLYTSVREIIAGSKIPIVHQALALRRRRHMQRYAVGQTEFVEDIPGARRGLLENGDHVLFRSLTARGQSDRWAKRQNRNLILVGSRRKVFDGCNDTASF